MSPTESAPPETAIHAIRNVLQAFEQPEGDHRWGIAFSATEAAAIVARLRAIQRELEGHGLDVTIRERVERVRDYDELLKLLEGADHLALTLQEHLRIANEATQFCHDHHTSAINLRAVGDHVERVYPEAASAADESDA